MTSLYICKTLAIQSLKKGIGGFFIYLFSLASEKFCVRRSAQLLYFLFGLIIQNNNILSRISLADLKNLSPVFEEI